MRDTRIKAGEVGIQVREYERDGKAVIFLHFGGANLMSWQRAVPYFQDRYRLILVDLRGHGKSDAPETSYHVDEMARDIVAVMEGLKIEKAYVIGSSMGAEVGLSLAANYPDRVAALVCDGALSSEFGPYGTWEGSEEDFQKHAEEQLENMRNAPPKVFPSLEALIESRREVFEKYGWWNEYVEAMERYGARKLDDGTYAKGSPRHVNEDYMKRYFQCRFEDYYRNVKCPLMMMPGEDALNDPKEKSAMNGLKGLATRARIVEVKGWEHPYGWLMNPEPACRAILKFFDEAL